MKEKLYRKFPSFLQSLLITIYNLKEYSLRYGGHYKRYRKEIFKNGTLNLEELHELQNFRLENLLKYAVQNSKFYRNIYANIALPYRVLDIHHLPIISKEELKANLKDIYTVSEKEGIISKTGGTTGFSMQVLYTPENMQERFAFLDDFRSRAGYELGKKTAWFSGKSLLTETDIKKRRFWKTDYWHKVRYYSTFHIKKDYLKLYVEDLIKFCPEFIVGFPSSIVEIAKFGIRNGYIFPENKVKAVFPTAETVTGEIREVIEKFFHTKVYNQYASSEGAPFIFECEKSNLHLELQSGIFEVLDDENNPANEGKLVVTSFTTYGTPLIRYDIGDSIRLEKEGVVCTCGNHNPLVKEILGRIDDFIYSPENGKINLGNVSNTTKDTKGIIKFQVEQNQLNSLEIYMMTDKLYNEKDLEIFQKNWRDRVGDNMIMNFQVVDHISEEKSGKFRIVKNNIKNLL